MHIFAFFVVLAFIWEVIIEVNTVPLNFSLVSLFSYFLVPGSRHSHYQFFVGKSDPSSLF